MSRFDFSKNVDQRQVRFLALAFDPKAYMGIFIRFSGVSLLLLILFTVFVAA